MENLRARKQLNLDNPNDVDWLYDWAKLAQKELNELREKVSQIEPPVKPEIASIEEMQKELGLLKTENEKLKFMIDNGLGWEDIINDISGLT